MFGAHHVQSILMHNRDKVSDSRSSHMNGYQRTVTDVLCTFDNALAFEREAFVFYLGAIGLLWFFVWQLAIHGSPSEHPTITPEEKDYIEESIAKLPAAKVNGKLICCLT